MIRNSFQFVLLLTCLLWYGCTGKGAEQRAEAPEADSTTILDQPETHGTEVNEVALTNPLDPKMVKAGSDIYDLKCSSCHKLTEDRIVGPGWAGVTKRRKPEWIINMITNVEMMLAEDAEAQKLLELCLVRMPNQNISKEEARSVIEFMRKNDGEK
ncbi:c-type cytochrome [Runella slithyformis]|uniref:Cytochrome c class I n=1 Tax=Runella slithyformis (strain ATCC 29530 / DSM 19594 / LMG 11500 / NCIMB 11436 / LSU 4) TaxID=761193 RepID=A0A7U3ZG24_RUNSL|nr:c-type cytochrome [Runella slithyformis]AEI46568.1 cytochrome c class I [Runella slithyformis DSM 19594]